MVYATAFVIMADGREITLLTTWKILFLFLSILQIILLPWNSGGCFHLASLVLVEKSVYNKNVSTCVDKCENNMGLPPLIGSMICSSIQKRWSIFCLGFLSFIQLSISETKTQSFWFLASCWSPRSPTLSIENERFNI